LLVLGEGRVPGAISGPRTSGKFAMDLSLIHYESMAYKQIRVGRKVWRKPPPESVK
jgi:hypothetical protein